MGFLQSDQVSFGTCAPKWKRNQTKMETKSNETSVPKLHGKLQYQSSEVDGHGTAAHSEDTEMEVK